VFLGKSKFSVPAALLLLAGCTSPAPEPASAEAVERAVSEAEVQRDAAQASKGTSGETT
jgi:outer membrane biogenesis lipoprotein LolB